LFRSSGRLKRGRLILPSATTIDRYRDTRREREAFAKVRNAERSYAAKLRRVAQVVGDLVELLHPVDEVGVNTLVGTLERYAELLRPWARAAAQRMLREVARRDELAWNRYSAMMGVELRQQLQGAPVGAVLRQLQEEQVTLITSIPVEAGRRAQAIARGSLYTAERPKNLIDEILRTGEVTASRATLIARTETAKAASLLTQTRATHVGSDGYIWRTSRDADVRESHKKMEGKFVRWNEPPEVEPGRRYHAGQFPNCRCWAEPVLPDLDR
jgi:SPP1 gp7 family putative phage head morphogenesis protein